MKPAIPMTMVVSVSICLMSCGGGSGAPGAPTGVSVAAGTAAGTATVSFVAPVSTGSSAITGYTVTANPGGITATGASSPIALTGLTTGTAYTYSVVATNGDGSSPPATTGLLSFYAVVETFHEPMTQPNDTVFSGTFTYDATSKAVSNLSGSLTEAMTGPPMTTVALAHQLSSTAVTLDSVNGVLVTAFALTTTDTFDPSGFAPGGTQYFGLSTGAPNPSAGGVGNAYAMIFVNLGDPTAALTQDQIDKLAYADCTAGGMMMTTCMTGTTMAGYGKMGTMMGQPASQVVTRR